ncbi:MAG: hypothetical protein D8M57_19960 [Candidatus Scalindua sp. AMX11]|nr:MAG: hypothetical protein D8M57_19960 [Candidatus Scalindua sp. AMX11]
MESKPSEQKPPYCVERRTFDPQILNNTLKLLTKSIDDHKKETNAKIKEMKDELKDEIRGVRNSCKEKDDKIVELDKELAVHQASQEAGDDSTENLANKRNNLLFQILTLMTAVGAAIFTGLMYFKKGGS